MRRKGVGAFPEVLTGAPLRQPPSALQPAVYLRGRTRFGARRTPVRMITALGIDPGLRATGYSIIQGDRRGCRVQHLGAIQTTQTDLFQRLRQTYQEIASLLREHRPDVVVLEDLFAHQAFPRTALDLAHVRGVIGLAAALADIPIETLTPAAVKRALTGSGGARKAQVQAMVALLLGLPVRPGQHAADAAALALTALSRRGARLRAMPVPEESLV